VVDQARVAESLEDLLDVPEYALQCIVHQGVNVRDTTVFGQ
jgi:hypothetical protein